MDEQLRRLQSRDWRPAKFRTGKPLTRPGESGQQGWDVMSPLRPRMLGSHLTENEIWKNLDVKLCSLELLRDNFLEGVPAFKSQKTHPR